MGRAAVDLYADQVGAELEDASSFSKYVGGCAANIAIGSARLGSRTAMLTRVGKEAMGRYVRRSLQEEGVDTSLVKDDPERLTGLVLLGVSPPDHFPLIFYRADCADMALQPEDFQREHIAQAQQLLITGTQMSSIEQALVCYRAAQMAGESGTSLVLDIDYRPVLWGVTGHDQGESRYVATQHVAQRLEPLLADCQIIVGTEEEIRIAAGEDDLDAALHSLRSKTRATLVMKRGPAGCTIYPAGTQESIDVPGFNVDVLNVLGAGDAFLSGFLRAQQEGLSWEDCGRWGNACGAIVVNRHGCSPAMPDRAQLKTFLREQVMTPQLAERYFLLKRPHVPQTQLAIMAIDHLEAFEELASERNLDAPQIIEAKRLLAQIVDTYPASRIHPGLLLDQEYSKTRLSAVPGGGRWQGRALRHALLDGNRLGSCQDPSSTLRSWPQHQVVKVLVKVGLHPKERQHVVLQALHEACTSWGHHLLIELVGQTAKERIAYAGELLDMGIQVSWWKINSEDCAHWDAWEALVQAQLGCQGILLLGQGQALAALTKQVQLLAQKPAFAGFAVGRSLWSDALERLWDGTIDPQAFEKLVSEGYQQLCDALACKAGIEEG
jgi:5-dehydro-2-deoxygluconokinase